MMQTMSTWTAALGVAALLMLGSIANSNTIAPWLLDAHEQASLLLFVDADCADCQAIYVDLQSEAPTWVIAYSEHEGYGSLIVDTAGILISTFRITTYPTLIVSRSGQEVIRQVGWVDKQVVVATIEALRANLIPHTWEVGIEVGTRVPGRFADFTGLIVYWEADCDWCQRESGQVETLQALDDMLVEVIVARESEELDDSLHLWDLAGAPMHIYLRAGVPLWIDIGYRDDLVELVQKVAATAP